VYARTQRKVALIDWPLKLMVFERKKSDRVFLFDLGADPRETEDASRTKPDEVARLRELKSKFESAAR